MPNIEGVLLTPKKIVGDERGKVMQVLRADEPCFLKFGEAYISAIFPNVVKGWKLHTLSTSNMVVPVGEVQFLMHDTREGSVTKGKYENVTIGESNYQLLTIPPGVVYAWRNTQEQTAFVLNCATELWSPNESSNLSLDTYPCEW
ncbi:MAG: dTDP-4-dehydrorhamnose 3,5-epimerase family protein [Patescibacteria group bacterium]